MKPKYYSVQGLVVPLRSEDFRKVCTSKLYTTTFYQYQVPFVVPEAHIGRANLKDYFEEVPLPATTLDQWLEILTTKPKHPLRGMNYQRLEIYVSRTLHTSSYRTFSDLMYNTLGSEASAHGIQSLHYIALEAMLMDSGHLAESKYISPESVAALLMFPIELAKFARFIKA